jgi:hypothetical protein
MRSTVRRLLAGLGIVAAAAAVSVLAAPAPAHAACYTVQVGSDGITVCP